MRVTDWGTGSNCETTRKAVMEVGEAKNAFRRLIAGLRAANGSVRISQELVKKEGGCLTTALFTSSHAVNLIKYSGGSLAGLCRAFFLQMVQIEPFKTASCK